jgi:fructokinase
MRLFGGVETGGTKIVCVVGDGPTNIVAETSFPTTTPDETISRAITFFREQMQSHELEALGIGTFGPVDLNTESATYGYITTTPKPGWSNVDLLGSFARALPIPMVIDTDVNAAAMGEYTWGNAKGIDPFVYYTIGTGIGMGGMVNHTLLHGLTHPEAGHMILRHDLNRDPFPGACTYHGDCFEGLATGFALEKRWNVRGETLSDDHPAWALEANYIAQALVNTILMLSPKKIVIGGGVMQRDVMLPLIRKQVVELLNGYVQSDQILSGIDTLIVPPGLGKKAGVLGAIALAQTFARVTG